LQVIEVSAFLLIVCRLLEVKSNAYIKQSKTALEQFRKDCYKPEKYSNRGCQLCEEGLIFFVNICPTSSTAAFKALKISSAKECLNMFCLQAY